MSNSDRRRALFSTSLGASHIPTRNAHSISLLRAIASLMPVRLISLHDAQQHLDGSCFEKIVSVSWNRKRSVPLRRLPPCGDRVFGIFGQSHCAACAHGHGLESSYGMDAKAHNGPSFRINHKFVAYRTSLRYTTDDGRDSPFFHNGDFSSLDSRLEERWSVRALRRIDPQTRL